jgi:hypothetical protein
MEFKKISSEHEDAAAKCKNTFLVLQVGLGLVGHVPDDDCGQQSQGL